MDGGFRLQLEKTMKKRVWCVWTVLIALGCSAQVRVYDSFDDVRVGQALAGRSVTDGAGVWRDRFDSTGLGDGCVAVTKNNQQAVLLKEGIEGVRTLSCRVNLNQSDLSGAYGGIYLAMTDDAGTDLFAVSKQDILSVRLITAGPHEGKLQLRMYDAETGGTVNRLSESWGALPQDDLTLSLQYDPQGLRLVAGVSNTVSGALLTLSEQLTSEQADRLYLNSYGFGVVGYKSGTVLLDDFSLECLAAAVPAAVVLKQSLGGSPLEVYICAGQSNMQGARSQKALLPPELQAVQENIYVFDGADWRRMEPAEQGFGPEISFAVQMQAAGGKPIGIIKYSKGGTSLARDWNPQDPKSLYAELRRRVEAARRSMPIQLKGMIWMQGERDSREESMASAYRENLERLIQAARRDFDSPVMGFVAGRVNPLYPFVDRVRRAQESCRAEKYAFIDCDDLAKYDDNLHYDTASIVEMGRRFAARLIETDSAGKARAAAGSAHADVPAAEGTQAAAGSSRDADPSVPPQQCLPRFLGVGTLPMTVGPPSAALDGDQTTMWWSDADPEQDFTVWFDAPWTVRSVEIEWGTQYPSKYEIQATADGRRWETVFRADQFKNPATAHGKVAWVSNRLQKPFAARAIRIRTLAGEMDGVQIVDLFINGSLPYSFTAVPETALYKNEAAPIESRVNDLLGRMNFREKLRLTAGMNYFFIPGIERFGFHPVMMANASSGLKFQPTLPWDYKSLTQSTAFPLPAAVAATWDPGLAFELGAAIAKECRADGVSILLGPGVNIHRTSTCGRNFEYFSEDPFLSSRMAVMNIKGLQGEGVIATIKHFAVNNNEFLRTQSNVLVGERALNEIFLPSFRAAIEEADVKAVMSSYNWMNGEKCGESPALLDEILRKQLGFKGFVMSDWGGTTEDYAAQLTSGQNIIMPQMKRFGQAVRTQRITRPQETEAKLDAMIAPVVRVLLETGVWERPPASGIPVDFDAHDALARRIAESGITLLKNDGVLPLQAGETILVVGEEGAVKRAASGGGSVKVDGYHQVDYLAGLEALYGKAVTYRETPTAGEVQAADCVLFFFTMRDREGNDRPFELSPSVTRQIEMLAENNKKVIVVACTGTAFGMPWLEDVEGLVHSYFLGQSFGSALANVLSGAVNPSGKLPFTMEKSFSDSPAYGYNVVNGKEEWGGHFKGAPARFDLPYEEGVFVGYRLYEANSKPVHFPFGFGLSYSSFRMDNLKLSSDQIAKDSPVTVRVDVTNTGKTAGAEVVQLYVHDDEAGVARPYRELKGFQKVYLEPGQTRTVELPLTWNDLAFWDVQTHQWTAEKGSFTLLVGNSSRDVQCQARVEFR